MLGLTMYLVSLGFYFLFVSQLIGWSKVRWIDLLNQIGIVVPVIGLTISFWVSGKWGILITIAGVLLLKIGHTYRDSV
jgi:hypothetical protein